MKFTKQLAKTLELFLDQKLLNKTQGFLDVLVISLLKDKTCKKKKDNFRTDGRQTFSFLRSFPLLSAFVLS